MKISYINGEILTNENKNLILKKVIGMVINGIGLSISLPIFGVIGIFIKLDSKGLD